MTSAHRNDVLTAQEKLEWVTPKISLMEVEDTSGKLAYNSETGGIGSRGGS